MNKPQHPYSDGVSEDVLNAVRLRMRGSSWRRAAQEAGASLSQLQKKYPSVSAAIERGEPLKVIRVETVVVTL